MVAEADVRLLNKQYLSLSYQFHFPIHHLTLTDLNTHPWLNEYTTRAISIYIKHLPPIFFVASTHSNPIFMHFHNIFYSWYTSTHLTRPARLESHPPDPRPRLFWHFHNNFNLYPPPCDAPGFVLQFYNNSNFLFTSIPPTILAYLSRRLKVELIVMETPVVRTPVKSFKRHLT